MVWSRTLLGCAAVLALLSAPARAADMPGYPPEPPSLPPHEAPPEVENFGGWYLRGDLGYAWGISPDAESAAPFLSPTENKLGNGFVGGIGAGYKSRWLRTDVTLDYTAPLKYTGSIAAPDDTTAKVEAVTALFNGYVDLGTWYRATPYVGKYTPGGADQEAPAPQLRRARPHRAPCPKVPEFLLSNAKELEQNSPCDRQGRVHRRQGKPPLRRD